MIEWQRVSELREEIGAEDFADVVELFLEEVDDAIGRLRSSPDPDNFESDLHFLKGSALNLGFTAFAALCSVGEQMAATGAAAGIDIAAVIQAYDSARAEFTSGLEMARPAA